MDKWLKLIYSWAVWSDMICDHSAYGHLLSMVVDNLGRNWKYFDAPMIVWKEYHE